MQLIETLNVKYYWSLTKNLSIRITLCIVMYYSYITIDMQDIYVFILPFTRACAFIFLFISLVTVWVNRFLF